MRFRLGIVFIVVSAISFAIMPVFARIAYDAGLDPPTTLFFRFAIAAVVMALLFRPLRLSLPPGKKLWGLAAAGAVGFVTEALCFYYALTMISAALTTILLFTFPAIVTLALFFLKRERPNKTKLIALGLASTGTALAVGVVGQAQLTGVILGLLAALIYAGYILVAERFSQGVDGMSSAFIIIVGTALSYGAIVLARGGHWPQTIAGWWAVIGLGVISTIVAICGFWLAVERIGTATASTLATLEPIFAAIFAAYFLNESLHVQQWIGGALILTAVVLLIRAKVDCGPAPDVEYSI